MRFKAFLRKYWLDVLLLAGFLGGFQVFVRNSMEMERQSGIRARVAILTQGAGVRRTYASTQPEAVGEGAEFVDMDSIWTGKQQTATLELEDGGFLDLEEKTLLVLRAPFRPRAKINQRFRVLSGRVRLREKGSSRTIQSENRFAEIPSERDVKKEEDGVRSYPQPNAWIVAKNEAAEIPFSWYIPTDGHLVVREKNTGVTNYHPVKNQSYLQVALAGSGHYVWQVVSGERKIVQGPFEFELRSGAKDLGSGLRPVLRDGSSRPIDLQK